MATSLTQLVPKRRQLDAEQAYGTLGLADLAPPDRPYVIANMVSSADGRATHGGKSAGVSGDADRELFGVLRTQTDAVMAGTRTIAMEGYGPLARTPGQRERRVALGLDPVPVAITATRSMQLPADTPLFADPGSRVIVLTCSAAGAPECAASLTVVRTPGETIDFGAALRRLRSEHAVRSILMEGGPTLLGAMVSAGLVDELFLTVSPLLVGGRSGHTIVEGSPPLEPARLDLRSLITCGGSLFLRYAVQR